MNKKGFTLIELLAVIILLGIIMVIAIPISINNYKGTKEKSEKIFLNNLSTVIKDYITLNGSSLAYGECGLSSCVITKDKPNDTTIQKAQGTITLETITNDSTNMISKKDLINPNDKKECSLSSVVEIYRDSDYVYCHRVKLDCVGTDNDIDIDTCNFEG